MFTRSSSITLTPPRRRFAVRLPGGAMLCFVASGALLACDEPDTATSESTPSDSTPMESSPFAPVPSPPVQPSASSSATQGGSGGSTPTGIPCNTHDCNTSPPNASSGAPTSPGTGSTNAAGGTSGGEGGNANGGSLNTGGASGGSSGSAAAGDTSTGAGGEGLLAGGGAGGSEPRGGAAGTDDENDRCEVGDGSAKTPLTLSGNTFAHDPTMIKVDQTYYRFWTGERIQRSTSNDLLRWSNTTTVYTAYPEWVTTWLASVPGQTFNFPWAPDVAEFGGQIHLYSSFSAKFGDNVSCITHLTTDDIAGNRWTDHGPIICSEGHENYNAIDADIGFDTDGNPYFSFGSFWDGIFAFPLNPDGSRKGNDLTRLAWAPQIEAPVFLSRCGYYYLFVTWGLCCPGEGRRVSDLTYRVVVGRSENILGPYVDKTGTSLIDGGGTLVVQGDRVDWAAAGHSDVLIDGDKIYHTYHAYAQSNGNASLRIVELAFDAEGWPLPHAP